MLVKVKLFASLRRYSGEKRAGTPVEVEVPEGGTVLDLLSCLEIPPEEAHLTFVNGIAQPQDWKLRPGDEIGIFPPIGGGS